MRARESRPPSYRFVTRGRESQTNESSREISRVSTRVNSRVGIPAECPSPSAVMPKSQFTKEIKLHRIRIARRSGVGARGAEGRDIIARYANSLRVGNPLGLK